MLEEGGDVGADGGNWGFGGCAHFSGSVGIPLVPTTGVYVYSSIESEANRWSSGNSNAFESVEVGQAFLTGIGPEISISTLARRVIGGNAIYKFWMPFRGQRCVSE